MKRALYLAVAGFIWRWLQKRWASGKADGFDAIARR